MSHYKRNAQGKVRNADQEWNAQIGRNRKEDLYGDQKYYEENYRNPYKPASQMPDAGEQESTRSRYADREHEDRSNYGRGGYYGNTYDQEAYNRDRNRQRMGLGENSRRLQERGEDDGRGGWWETEYAPGPASTSVQRRFGQIGPYKGKGPQGYQRSDERIREDINERLSDDPSIDASDIEVRVENCEVILTGTVDDRYAKRHAEDIVESVSGVKNLENRLRVKNKNEDKETRVVGNERSKTRESMM